MESPFTDFMGVNKAAATAETSEPADMLSRDIDGSKPIRRSSFKKILKKTDVTGCRMLLSGPAVGSHIVPHLTPAQCDVLRKGEQHINIQAVDEKTGKSYSAKLKKTAYTYYLGGTADLVKDKNLQANQVIEFSWRDGVLVISD